MVMIIIHLANITCLVTNDSWHVYGAIVLHKIHHGAGRISCFADRAILWLAGTVMGEVGTHNRGACPTSWPGGHNHRKYIVLITE